MHFALCKTGCEIFLIFVKKPLDNGIEIEYNTQQLAYANSKENSMKTMRNANIGDTVTVVRVHGEGALRRRIMDMGITKGVTVFIRKVAPLGDPVEVTVRGYELSLRKADTEMIEIE